METIKDVKNMNRPGTWDATIDLFDAYYHIGIHRFSSDGWLIKIWCIIFRLSRKYLRFIIEWKLYEFNALPTFICCIVCVFAVQSQNLHKTDQIYVATVQETGHTGKQYIYNSLCDYII